jgi:hypothetical protein
MPISGGAAGQAQRFRPRRHLLSAPKYRYELTQRFQTWREITGTTRAA